MLKFIFENASIIYWGMYLTENLCSLSMSHIDEFIKSDWSPSPMVKLVWSKLRLVSSPTSSSWLKTVSCPPNSSAFVNNGILRVSMIWRIRMDRNGYVMWPCIPAFACILMFKLGKICESNIAFGFVFRPTLTGRSLSSLVTLLSSCPLWLYNGLIWSSVRQDVIPSSTKEWSMWDKIHNYLLSMIQGVWISP